MPEALTSNSPGLTPGKWAQNEDNPGVGCLQNATVLSGAVYDWKATPPELMFMGGHPFPGWDPGYWKLTPLVTIITIISISKYSGVKEWPQRVYWQT